MIKVMNPIAGHEEYSLQVPHSSPLAMLCVIYAPAHCTVKGTTGSVFPANICITHILCAILPPIYISMSIPLSFMHKIHQIMMGMPI